MQDYYFVNLFYLLIPLIYYIGFRGNVHTYLRAKRISKTKINKEKKGYKNYWWYYTINKNHQIKFIFYINLIFTIIYPIAFIISLLIGWIELFAWIIFVFSAMCHIISAIMNIFSSMQYNLEYHKKRFVILAKSSNDGIDSIIFDFAITMFPILLVYTQLLMLLRGF